VTDAVLILSTCGSREEADRIARALVEERLAACVQVSAIESWYRWQGKTEHAPEQRLHIKTIAALAETVTARIAALHSYDVPEIIVVPITGGSADYLAWITDSVSTGNAP
jgi:periplasmic divalent cation tolerance protein